MAATLDGVPGVDVFVREMVVDRKLTHEQISLLLKRRYPGLRGLSPAIVKRFCCSHEMHKTARLDSASLDRLVAFNVMRVIINKAADTVLVLFFTSVTTSNIELCVHMY